MTTEEDVKNKSDEESVPPEALTEEERPPSDLPDALATLSSEPTDMRAMSDTSGEEVEGGFAPTQLGTQRFVYAAYFAGGIAIAFLLSKALSYAWLRLSTYKPSIGEPHDEIVIPIAGLIGLMTAIYYYRDQKTRTLAEEVAFELGKVSWPSRDEVVNGTFVVIVTTVIATTFFALMDRFWGFVTNLVYGA
jgi:preprotein translocase subunit SecE